ncbi:hypothetical protein SALBM311S_05173 [Streptomyces alboniger]
MCLAGAGGAGDRALVGRRGAPVGGPQGQYGGGDDGGDDGRGDGTRAQPVPARGTVLGVHREAAPVEAGRGPTRAWEVRRRRAQGRTGRREDRQFGGGDDGAGPAAGSRTLGGAAAVRAVVDVPDEFAAQGRAEHQLVVAGEPGDARAAAGLHYGQGRTCALDLAGGGGEQFAGGGGTQAEHGGELVGGKVMTDGEFERLALLRGGTGGLRPGEQGQFAPALLLDVVGDRRVGGLRAPTPVGAGAARRVRALTFLLGLGQPAQTAPAGQRVQPGPVVPGGLRAAALLGEREGVAEGGGRGVVVAQHGQAVGEQTVQVRLVARERPMRQGARRRAVARLPVRPVCAGEAGRGLRSAAHHLWTVGGAGSPLLVP